MIFKNKLLKNATTLASGVVIAQLIPLLLQPVLKRLYDPVDFGVYEIYFKLLSLIVVLYSLKFDMGIVLPKNHVKALLLVYLSFFLAVVSFVVLELLIFLFSSQMNQWLKFPPEYGFVIYLIPLGALLFALSNMLNFYLIRLEKFKSISYNKFFRRFFEASAQLGLFSVFRHGGLFLADVIGNFANFISAFFQSFRNVRIDKRFFNIRLLMKIAKEYRELPLYNILPEFLNTAYLSVLSFFILSKFDLTNVGYLELSQKILAVPVALVSYSIGQVLLQRFSLLVNEKKSIRPMAQKIVLLLLGVALPVVLVFVLVADDLFALFFGDEWIASATFSKYLVVFYLAVFVSSPLGSVLVGLRKFKIDALWKIGRFFTIIPLFLVSSTNIYTYLFIYAAIGTFSYFVYLLLIFIQIQKYEATLNPIKPEL